MTDFYPITAEEIDQLSRSDISIKELIEIKERVTKRGFPLSGFPLLEVPTCVLVDELSRREAVKEIQIPAYGKVEIAAEDLTKKFEREMPDGKKYLSSCFYDEFTTGPARILVVTD